jgi:hypothetical protein
MCRSLSHRRHGVPFRGVCWRALLAVDDDGRMDPRWAAVDDYLVSRLVMADPVLDAVLQASASAGLPPHHVTPNQGKLLHLLAQAQGAHSVLEIGTLGGYSAIWSSPGSVDWSIEVSGRWVSGPIGRL